MENPFISYIGQRHTWVEAQLEKLSAAARIAQLIHVAAYSNRDQAHIEYILELVGQYQIGGLTFFQGEPGEQARLTNLYQAAAQTPLMISIDAEWGLGMRLDHTIHFPYQMALGAIHDERFIYEMGAEIARQCKRIGIHLNFAPVVDVNNNPANPVIGFRSFGEDVPNIISKARAYMKGMQDEKVMACAKHFPGHGDTDVDSHFSLPTITHDRARLEAVELVPFRALIKAGVGSIMVAHLHIAAIDSVKGRASSLSPDIVNGLLKKDLDYKGLVITDALDMKGVSQSDSAATVGMKALLAGNDVLLNITDVPGTIAAIQQAMAEGKITQEEIDERCRKNLKAKWWMGLDKYEPIKLTGVYKDINQPEAFGLCHQLHRASISVIRNEGYIIPLAATDKVATIAVHIDSPAELLPKELAQHSLEKGADDANKDAQLTIFQQYMDDIRFVDHYRIDSQTSSAELKQLLTKFQAYDTLLLSLHGIAVKAKNRFGISDKMIAQVNAILEFDQVISCVFASVYTLDVFEMHKSKGLILAYQENELTQVCVGELFG